MITKQNSGGRWAAWFGLDDGSDAKHAVFGYATKAEAIAACNAKASPTLVRYVGPLAAYRGAIGWSAEGGAMIGGRLREGTVEPASFVANDGEDTARFDSWQEAADWLAANLTCEDGVRAAEPCPEGFNMTYKERVLWLEVV